MGRRPKDKTSKAIEPIDVVRTRIGVRVADYIRESQECKKMPEVSRHDIAYKAVMLWEQIHRLTMEKLLDIGYSEEMRTLPSLHAEYRRTMESLGLSSGELVEQEAPEL